MLLPHDQAGSGPGVVLLHAGVADRTMWVEHLAPLARAGYHAVAMDLPGFGEAPLAEGSAAWLDVAETMDALAMESAAVVGNSYGGAVALRLAVVVPERVAGLVLVSVPAPDMVPSPELSAAWAAEEEALERGDIDAAVAAVVETWTLPDAPAQLRDRVAAMQRRAFAVQLEAGDVEDAADPLEDAPPLLARLAMPTLIAVGALDKPEFHTSAQTLSHGIGCARPTVIGGAGHLAPLERPEAFRGHLLDFLRETVLPGRPRG